MGRKIEQLRWTLDRAAYEFGVDRKTLAKRMTSSGIEPGTDGKFSTAQICKARFGDKAAKELEKLDKENEGLDIKNGKAKRALIELAVVEKAWEEIALGAKTRIALIPTKVQSRLGLNDEQAKVIESEVDEVLNDLSKPPDYQSARAEEADGEDA